MISDDYRGEAAPRNLPNIGGISRHYWSLGGAVVGGLWGSFLGAMFSLVGTLLMSGFAKWLNQRAYSALSPPVWMYSTFATGSDAT